MKYVASSFLLAIGLSVNTLYAQVITDANNNVGIGTTTPREKLDVNGNLIVSGGISSVISGNDVGGMIHLNNPAKTANGSASRWSIYNMSGNYGNSLQFWAYDNLGCVEGGLCTSRLTLMDNGNVGVGTSAPAEKLSVNGNILAKKVRVSQNWADYVFDPAYTLKPLEEVSSYIKENKHLPDMPAAKEIEQKGLDLGEIVKQQQVKIEELTLYIIEQDKAKQAQQKQLDDQAALLKQLQSQLQQLQKSAR